MDIKKPLNREAIGKRIGQVRRKARLTQNEFAKRLQTPVIITEIAEHGIKFMDDAVSESINISAEQLVHLLKLISKIYNVPLDWLMYGDETAFEKSKYVYPYEAEITLYLPVTICDQSLTEEMNDALILMGTNLRQANERTLIQRDRLESIVQKYRLYEQHAVFSGNTHYVNLARTKMLEIINRTQRLYC